MENKYKYKIITLCGSTRFKDLFFSTMKNLTLKGYIVLMPGVFGHADDKEALDEYTKKELDKLHLAKIDISDEILVINCEGYIGESTRKEIEYAVKNNKPVKYLFDFD